MTDLSSALDDILKKHNARLAQHRRSIEDLTDEFLRDAYQIQSHISSLHQYLRQIRGAYLSTSNASSSRSNKRHSHSHSHSQSTSTSTSIHLTNPQREAIDGESKSTLRDLSSAISRLAATETQRREIRRQLVVQKAARRFPLGALGRWAAGDDAQRGGMGVDLASMTEEERNEENAERTTVAWRDAVLWFLRQRLGAAAECQRDMMERRIMRELEKNKSVLYKVKGEAGALGGGAAAAAAAAAAGAVGGGVGVGGGGNKSDAWEGIIEESSVPDMTALIDAEDDGKFKNNYNNSSNGTANKVALESEKAKDDGYGLTPEQLALFAEENNQMLKHYEDTLDQVRAAERSMVEISELQTTLAQNLSIQAERIDVLVEDSQRTEENVSGGNKQLKQASERWRPAKMMFWVTCGLSGFLIFWDLVV